MTLFNHTALSGHSKVLFPGEAGGGGEIPCNYDSLERLSRFFKLQENEHKQIPTYHLNH